MLWHADLAVALCCQTPSSIKVHVVNLKGWPLPQHSTEILKPAEIS